MSEMVEIYSLDTGLDGSDGVSFTRFTIFDLLVNLRVRWEIPHPCQHRPHQPPSSRSQKHTLPTP